MVTIYRLYCIHTNESYVGCTKAKLGKRMREHRCLLNKRRHSAKRMQDLWDQYGSSGFRLESLESLKKDATVIDKRKREIFWMEHYDKQGLLLNHAKVSFQPPVGASKKAAEARVRNGYRPSKESNIKRRLAQLGKPKGRGWKEHPCPICNRMIEISNLCRHVTKCEKQVMR